MMSVKTKTFFVDVQQPTVANSISMHGPDRSAIASSPHEHRSSSKSLARRLLKRSTTGFQNCHASPCKLWRNPTSVPSHQHIIGPLTGRSADLSAR